MRRWLWIFAILGVTAVTWAADVDGPRRGRWPMHPRHRPAGRPFGAEAEAKVRRFAKEHFPAFLDEKLTAMKADKPQAYRTWIGRLAGMRQRHERLKVRNPKLAEAALAEDWLRVEVEYMAARYRAATGEKKATLREDISEKAGGLFDATQKRRLLEVADFQKRLGEIQTNLKRRETRRKSVVAKFVADNLARRRHPATRPASRRSPRPASRPAARPGRIPGPRMEQRILGLIQANQPERARHLRELKESDPRKYWRTLWREWHVARRRMLMRRFNPALAKVLADLDRLQREARRLGREYRKADAVGRPGIKTKLQAVAAKWFDVSNERIRLEAKRIEKHLDRIKADIERRRRLRSQILLKYVGGLLLEDTPEM